MLHAMPQVPVPADVDEFLRRPNAAVIASLRRDGAPHTVATWYDWKGGRIMLNMDPKRVRLEHIRRDPRVALTVFDKQDWEVHLSLLGRQGLREVAEQFDGSVPCSI